MRLRAIWDFNFFTLYDFYKNVPLLIIVFDNVSADSCNYVNWDIANEDGNIFIIKPVALIKHFTIDS